MAGHHKWSEIKRKRETPVDVTPISFNDESYDHGVCFLAFAGFANDEPCWGLLTTVPDVILPDEGGGTPGDVLLCAGHLPVYEGQPYRAAA